ncbi:hypothetical protein CARUB_v10019283mg, partial [Capsella rubella]
MMEEGTLERAHDLKPSPSDSDMYMLYFKGLVCKETTELLVGFGVAILDQDENLLFQMKGPLHGSGITDLEAELIALKRGLTEAVSMGINHLSICCDHDQIFELVMGRSAPEVNNIALLVDDVQRIRQQLKSVIPVLVTDQNHQASFVTKLAMEAIDYEISIRRSMTCSICFNNNFKAEDIFSSFLCSHRFCKKCVKRYIEVKLLEGGVPRCPYYQCESMLTLSSCASLVITPRLQEMWEERIKEESVPMADRVYCPNTNCSSLMSKTELSKSIKQGCVKCTMPFCINCKVPWHDNMSCNEYKRLMGTNLTTEDKKLNLLANRMMWRQCGKCKHMIERSEGCIHVTCRCGYSFCYTCGAEWTTRRGCSHKEEMDGDLCCDAI